MSSAAIVAGNHRDLKAQLVQGGNRLLRGVLDRIGYSDNRGQFAVDRCIERRFAFIGQLGGRARKGTDVEAELSHVAVGADFYAGAVDFRLYTKTGD